MSRYAPLAISVLAILVLAVTMGAAKGKGNQRAKNQQRSAAAQAKALGGAIDATKKRLQRAEAVAKAATDVLIKRQREAGGSSQRFHTAVTELEIADNERYGASQELTELRYRIEAREPDDSPVKKARAAYDAAVEALAEVRADIYESDKYQLLYEGAKRSANQAEELERVTKVCFDEDPDYAAAKQQLQSAKAEYNKLRYALYETDAAWAPAVERAKAAMTAQSKAATSVKASGAERGIERINLRKAEQAASAAHLALADARADLKRLEGQKKKLGKPTSKSTSGKSKK